MLVGASSFCLFFFNDTATTEIYTLSLHDALPILRNLITAEEAYFADSVNYTSNLGTAYATTTGVVGPTITVTANGFTAKIANALASKPRPATVGAPSFASANKACRPKPAQRTSPA